MITEQLTPTTTDTQQAQIRRALVTAINHGWIEWESVEDPLSAEDEFAALSLLGTHRAKLKKLGVTFPTKGQYLDRLEVVSVDAETWQVQNLTKGTEYTVTLAGLHLDCSCSKWGGGWCKHREAVKAWRDEHGAVAVAESKYQIHIVDDECATITGLPDVQHGLLRTSWGHIGCTCGADNCEHIEFAKDNWPRNAPPDEPVADYLFWHGDSEPSEILSSVQPATPHYDFTPHWTAPFPPSDEQSAALQSFGQWWGSDEPIFRLTGYAGTGKSTTAQAAIKYLKALPLPPKIAVAAAINKAVKVQDRILRQWGHGDIPTHTCAQLFGVRRKVIDGEETFIVDPEAHEYYQDYDLVIVDECSTINKQLWDMLLDATHNSLWSTRFIVMGDPAQLPPVNEGESMAFRHPCPSAHLSTVQRYDGSIAVIADDVRQNLDRPTFPTFTTDVDPDTKKGIYAVDRATWEAMIRKVFTGPDYQDNPEHCKVLAYTNKRVDALNVLVRNALGYRAPWVEGERIIALAPFTTPGCPPGLTTSDEATITQVYEGSTSGLDCWFLRLDNGETVPVPRNPAEFEAQLKELKRAKQHGKYWALKERFAAITYAYALTVHRSQGSTYRYCFVDVGDFRKCKGQCRTEAGQRILERNQLLYVALTRPSERLIISA